MLATHRVRRADLLALLLITLAVAAFFAPVWAGGGWLPAGGGDLVSFLWPTITFTARTIPGGLPLWNPHLYGGAPFWADNQSSVLYPPNLLLALLTDAPSYAALEGLAMLHVWLAGIGMYACLRLLRREDRLQPAPAALGGIAFMLSDVFVTHQGNLNLIAVAAWLPLVFLGTWRALGDAQADGHGSETRALSAPIRRVRALLSPWALLAGVTFGIGTLAGHAQMTYFTALLVIAASGWQFLAALIAWRRGRAAGSALWRMTGTLAVIGGIAFGLSAAGLIPALELTGYTARAGLTYTDAAAYSLPPRALIGLVAPWVDGRGPAAFSGDWARVEVGYIGALALILAGLGAIRGMRRRDGLAIFLTVAGIAAFLLALGEYFPLHRLAYELVPAMKSLRVPARFVLLADFAAASLAAMAVQGWMSPRTATSERERGMPRPYIAWGLAVLVGVELVAFGAGGEVQAANPTTGYAHADALDWLRSQPDAPFRIEGGPAAALWQPDLPALAGGPLYDIYGISNPLALAAYEAWYWGVDQRGSAPYNFLGVKYVVAPHDSPPGDASFVPVYEAASGVTIYLNTGALPLASLVTQAVPVASPEEAWTATHDPAWDPRTTVYVEDGPALDAVPLEGARLFFSVYEANTLAVVVNTPAPAYLVLAESAYPGWQAFIDGTPVPIYRANTAFRAIHLPEAGEHTVLLAFRPLSVIVGLVISGLTLIALGVISLQWAVLRKGHALDTPPSTDD